MDSETVVALIGIIPQLVLIAFALTLAVVFREPIRRTLTSRVTGVSGFGFRIDLKPDEVNEAVQARVKKTGGDESVPVAPRTGDQVVDRAQRLAPQLVGRLVLWVDDHPELVKVERSLLREMGIVTVAVRTNAQALDILSDPSGVVDVVISDIRRDDGSPGGVELLEDVRKGSKRPPVILYITRMLPDQGVPRGAFGLCNRVDELLNLVMDVLDRRVEHSSWRSNRGVESTPGTPTTRR